MQLGSLIYIYPSLISRPFIFFYLIMWKGEKKQHEKQRNLTNVFSSTFMTKNQVCIKLLVAIYNIAIAISTSKDSKRPLN